MKIRLLLSGALLLLMLATSGCREQEVASGLDNREAMEIVVALNRSGVHAIKQRESSGRFERFRVMVDETNLLKATEVLVEYGLPREKKESLEEVTRNKGFVPNAPQMAQLRHDFALSLQVERLLSALPHVTGVKAVVRSKGKDQPEGSSATIVLRYSTPSGNPPFANEEVQQMVSRSVPSLLAERVVVKTTPVYLPKADTLLSAGAMTDLTAVGPFLFQVPEKEKDRAQKQLAGILIFCCLCGAVLGFFFGSRFTRGKIARRAQQKSQANGENFFLEASFSPDGGDAQSKLSAAEQARRQLPGM